MELFNGDFIELKNIIKSVGIIGSWKEVASGYQYRTNDGAILNWFPSTGKINYQGNAIASEALKNKMNETITSTIASKGVISCDLIEQYPRIFIVHGHDTQSRTELELFLTKLGLDSFVLQNSSGGGLTIIEALEAEIGKKSNYQQFGIVLLTPDDFGYSKSDGLEYCKPRARQNAVLEMGMLISALGRKNVAILRKGDLEVPSDANGILYIQYQSSINEIKNKIVQRLSDSGIKIDGERLIKALG